MGYRSDVAYVIRFKDKAQCDTFINLQLAKADKHITGAINELTRVEDHILGFHTESVKWYDEYDDVKAHKTLLNEAIGLFSEGVAYSREIPYDDQAGYRFIRLGEEDEDNVVEDAGNSECLYEYIEWYRKLEVSFKTQPIGE